MNDDITKEQADRLLGRYNEGKRMLMEAGITLQPFKLRDGQITLAMCVQQELENGLSASVPVFILSPDLGITEKIMGWPGEEISNVSTTRDTADDILAGNIRPAN